MNLVEWLQKLMTNFGAGWVMWLMILLSVVSVAIMLERGWFYWSLRDDIGKLAQKLREDLRRGDYEAARVALERSPSAEAAADRVTPMMQPVTSATIPCQAPTTLAA